MKITKVSYQKTYSIGPYLTDRVGFEAEPEGIPGDSPMEILSWLQEIADEWHKKSHPHIYQDTINNISQRDANYSPPPSTTTFTSNAPIIIEYEKEPDTDYLSLIQSAATLESLKEYKLIAGQPGNEELYKAYCNRVKQLANG